MVFFPDQFLNSLFFCTFQDSVTFLTKAITKNSATSNAGERLIISSWLLASVPTKGKGGLIQGPSLKKVVIIIIITIIIIIDIMFTFFGNNNDNTDLVGIKSIVGIATSWHSNKFHLKVVSAVFLLLCFLSLNKSTC